MFSVCFPNSVTGYAVGENGIILKTTGTVNINESGEEQKINIYPNPTTGKFRIETKDALSKNQIDIYSMQGEKVYTLMLNTHHEIINVQLSPGIYFIKVIEGEKSSTQKLVIY